MDVLQSKNDVEVGSGIMCYFVEHQILTIPSPGDMVCDSIRLSLSVRHDILALVTFTLS